MIQRRCTAGPVHIGGHMIGHSGGYIYPSSQLAAYTIGEQAFKTTGPHRGMFCRRVPTKHQRAPVRQRLALPRRRSETRPPASNRSRSLRSLRMQLHLDLSMTRSMTGLPL